MTGLAPDTRGRTARAPDAQRKTAAQGVGSLNGGVADDFFEAAKLRRQECHGPADRASAFDVLDAIATYDGRELVGFTLQADGRWAAFGTDQRKIGTFSSRREALRAVME